MLQWKLFYQEFMCYRDTEHIVIYYGQVDQLKCLGVYTGHGQIKCQQLNWESKLESTLHQWNKKNLLYSVKYML